MLRRPQFLHITRDHFRKFGSLHAYLIFTPPSFVDELPAIRTFIRSFVSQSRIVRRIIASVTLLTSATVTKITKSKHFFFQNEKRTTLITQFIKDPHSLLIYQTRTLSVPNRGKKSHTIGRFNYRRARVEDVNS